MTHGGWCNKGPLGMIQGRFDPISMRAQDRDQGPIYKSQIKENQGNKNKGIGFGFQNPQPSCHQDGHKVQNQMQQGQWNRPGLVLSATTRTTVNEEEVQDRDPTHENPRRPPSTQSNTAKQDDQLIGHG